MRQARRMKFHPRMKTSPILFLSLKDLWALAQVIVIMSHAWRRNTLIDSQGNFVLIIVWEYYGSLPSRMIKLQIFWINIICSKIICDYVDTTFVWYYHPRRIICMMEGSLRYRYVKRVKDLVNYRLVWSLNSLSIPAHSEVNKRMGSWIIDDAIINNLNPTMKF